jgi:hypothetical protein
LRDSLRWTRAVLVEWRRWTRGHWRLTLVLSVLAFLVGWVWNTYVMAVDLGGSVVDPSTETSATADGHAGNGLFWLLMFSLAGGLFTYGWSRGWRALLADLGALPRRFGEAMGSSRAGAFAMLLWGASISLLIATLISSAVSLALGLVLLALAATPVGIVLNFALIRLWRGLSGVIAPAGSTPMLSPFMVMLGEALGLFLDWVIGGWLVGLVLGIACGVVSMLLSRAAAPGAATVVIMVGIAVLWQFAWMRWAYADDGGWSECASSDGRPCSELGLGGIYAWLRSPGAGHLVARGSIGAAFSAVGALIGVGLGGAMAGLTVAVAQAGALGQQPGQGRIYQSDATAGQTPGAADLSSVAGQPDAGSGQPSTAGQPAAGSGQPSTAGQPAAGSGQPSTAGQPGADSGVTSSAGPSSAGELHTSGYGDPPHTGADQASLQTGTGESSGEGAQPTNEPTAPRVYPIDDILPEDRDRDEDSGEESPTHRLPSE